MKVWVIHYEDPVRGEKGSTTYRSEAEALKQLRLDMENEANMQLEVDWKNPRAGLMESWDEAAEWVDLMRQNTPQATKEALDAYDAMIADSYAPVRISLSESIL